MCAEVLAHPGLAPGDTKDGGSGDVSARVCGGYARVCIYDDQSVV